MALQCSAVERAAAEVESYKPEPMSPLTISPVGVGSPAISWCATIVDRRHGSESRDDIAMITLYHLEMMLEGDMEIVENGIKYLVRDKESYAEYVVR